eukprot:maker-scaffold325_size206031-snap-gene-0.17 protein:Tk11598 transcript:maker-scaffold325_size206031-snap-gene-0.17-mRNA-1 annotation:"reverse transcriptase-like protein"
MSPSVPTIWLELDLPGVRRLLIGGVYRQWSSDVAATSSSSSISGLVMEKEQLDIITRAVLESIVKSDLVQHLLKVNALPNSQFGFRKNRSSTAAIATAQAQWFKGSQGGNVVGVLAFDLSFALDTVDKAQLIPKLAALGIKGTALSWFDSYLSGGWQCVDWSGTLSSFADVKFGVRQGSILGPCLFLVLMADLPDCLRIGEEYNDGYADDVSIWAINQRAESFARFAAGNGLIMNASKTQLMLGGIVRRADLEDFHVVVDRVTVFPDKKLELINVKFDSSFSTFPHGALVAASARQRAAMVARLEGQGSQTQEPWKQVQFEPGPAEKDKAHVESFTIGRGIGSEWTILSVKISRHHAKVQVWNGKDWFLCDIKSKNGVFINGLRVRGGNYQPIRHGDILRLGRTSAFVWAIQILPCPVALDPIRESYAAEIFEKVEAELDCPICRCLLIKPMILPCQHVFCQYCVFVWYVESSFLGTLNCPSCREITSPAELTELPFVKKLCTALVNMQGDEKQQNRQEDLRKRKIEDTTDDVSIWAVGKDLPTVKSLLDQQAKSFARFAAGNGLIMNASKTQLMLGGIVRRADLQDFHVVVDGVTVFPDKKLELLGVKLDSSFSTFPHGALVAASARQRAAMVARGAAETWFPASSCREDGTAGLAATPPVVALAEDEEDDLDEVGWPRHWGRRRGPA